MPFVSLFDMEKGDEGQTAVTMIGKIISVQYLVLRIAWGNEYQPRCQAKNLFTLVDLAASSALGGNHTLHAGRAILCQETRLLCHAFPNAHFSINLPIRQSGMAVMYLSFSGWCRTRFRWIGHPLFADKE